MPPVRLAALALTLFLAGCAGQNGGFLKPSATVAAGASRVDMLVATTRSPDGAGPGELFTGERGRELSFADIAVSIPPDAVRKIGEVQWPAAATANPATEFATLRADRIDRPEAIRRFSAQVGRTPGRHVLVFVHGYNTRFEEAVYRLAQFVHDSGAKVEPVLFTWPSRGKLLAYVYDRESANYSRDALEEVLRALARDGNVGQISILAHSMGNWVTLEALRQMAIRDRSLPAKIRNIMLAAPDVDVDVFRRQIAEIGAKHPPITLFVSQDDAALAASSRLSGDIKRVGAVDPAAEPYASDFKAQGLDVVDLTSFKSGDRLAHGKFAQSPQVVRDIGARLASGQVLNDGKASFGERAGAVAAGAASTVGGVAAAIVSLPVAIVDPATRRGLGDQLGDVGSGFGDTLRSVSGGTPNAR